MTTKRRPEQQDDWETDSGLADDIDVWITKARFGYLENYQGGDAALLIMDYESPDYDPSYPIIWPLGTGWDISDGGLSVQHEKGRERFINISMMGRLIERCKSLDGLDMRGRGSSRDARVWEGLGFHMVREKIRFEGGAERGLKEEIEHLMPVAYLGDKKGKKGVGKKVVAKTVKDEETDTDSDTQEDSNATDQVLVAKLTTLAKKLDRDKFQKMALDMKELNTQENSDLLTEVLDDTEEGFWAKARA